MCAWDFRVVPTTELGHDGPDPAASQFWYRHADLFRADSKLYVDVEGGVLLPQSTWDLVEQMLHHNAEVRAIELTALQKPYVELEASQGSEINVTYDFSVSRPVAFHRAFQQLNTQLVKQMRVAWKRQLLELQDGYYSKKNLE